MKIKKNNIGFKNNIYELNSGFALILTLWTLAVISILILTFSMAVNLNLKNAAYIKDCITEKGYTDAAINRMTIEVLYPPDKKKYSGKKGDKNKKNSDKKSNSDSSENVEKKEDKEKQKKRAEWYYKVLGKWYVDVKSWKTVREKPIHAGDSDYVLCIVSAEDARFDLKKLKDIENLTKYSDEIIKNIKEKFENDKKFRFTCVPQLLTIDGVKGEYYDGDGQDLKGLKNILTTFSDGKVYINTAYSEVLSMIPGIDSGSAEIIADNKECLSNYDELSALIGTAGEKDKKKLEKWLKFVPEYFNIKAYRNANGIDRISEAIVNVKDGQVKILLLK